MPFDIQFLVSCFSLSLIFDLVRCSSGSILVPRIICAFCLILYWHIVLVVFFVCKLQLFIIFLLKMDSFISCVMNNNIVYARRFILYPSHLYNIKFHFIHVRLIRTLSLLLSVSLFFHLVAKFAALQKCVQ